MYYNLEKHRIDGHGLAMGVLYCLSGIATMLCSIFYTTYS